MIYTREIQIEFNACDPAGIVFYPRYFEMMNSLVENFFIDVAQHPYARMMDEGAGVPTAKVSVDFRAPTRLEERLLFSLRVVRVGGSSITFRIEAHGGAELRLEADLVLVWVRGGQPQPWPAATKARLITFQEAQT